MIALLQRVSQASVRVSGDTVGAIDNGLLVLVGFDKYDNESVCAPGVDRILSYRIFEDANGRMNRSVSDCGGGILFVPQFTLVADTAKGNRPGFSTAAEPPVAETLFNRMVTLARRSPLRIECGKFGAQMDVRLTNRGPATFALHISPVAEKT